jgi:flagellar biogenesis protein FliO
MRLQNGSGLLSRALNWIRTRQSGRSRGKRLHVGATVSLGEKRFVAVIQVDGQQFLVGGGATNVTLLAQLNGKETFGELLSESMTVDGKQFGELAAAHAGLQA